jgi:pyruvate/2-oxoglutarate dehydrogenase complex dihydrolipoamide acyltransferase (E2) component
MSSPFAPPASPATGIQWTEYLGALLIFSVKAVETGINTSFGESDAVRANVAVLDGNGAGEEHEEVLVFPKVLQSQLRSRVGQMVLGRLTQGQGKPGQSPPWMLDAATPADEQAAAAWLAARNAPVAPDAPQPAPTPAPAAAPAAAGNKVPF